MKTILLRHPHQYELINLASSSRHWSSAKRLERCKLCSGSKTFKAGLGGARYGDAVPGAGMAPLAVRGRSARCQRGGLLVSGHLRQPSGPVQPPPSQVPSGPTTPAGTTWASHGLSELERCLILASFRPKAALKCFHKMSFKYSTLPWDFLPSAFPPAHGPHAACNDGGVPKY